jgi:hypothetical protein
MVSYLSQKHLKFIELSFFYTFATMDDFKIWFYILIGVIYVLSRLRKKPEQKPLDTPYEQDRQVPSRPVRDSIPTTNQPKQLTFEELLREITQTKEPEPEPLPRKSEYVDYDDDLKEEEQDLETAYSAEQENRGYPEYEKAKQEAFYRKSLEETMKIGDTDIKFAKFNVFEDEKKRNLLEEYTRDLSDPEGLKKAVVLNEIFNRRF